MKLQVGDYAKCDAFPTLFGTIVAINGGVYRIKIDQKRLAGRDRDRWYGTVECNGANWGWAECPYKSAIMADMCDYYRTITGDI